MLKEQCLVSDYFEEYGLKEDDLIRVLPASGKGYHFYLNRTCFDFVSDSLWDEVDSICKKRLVGMNKEKLHVQLRRIPVQGRNNIRYERYFLKVIQGGAVKLNGTYVLEALIERGDRCEIGHNELKFQPQQTCANGNDLQERYLLKYKKLVESDMAILIQGETGIGKTTFARKIHEQSKVLGDFVHLNIASYSPQLIESELFGHAKGAFTGAISDQQGAFRLAQNGTLFIDEIDSLPWELQTKLLIFLDEYKARAVGESKEYKVKTRLIFASGRNLASLVEKKQMRRDFYFRLTSGHTFKMHPLRDEPEYIARFCQQFEINNNILIDKKLLEFYTTLPWPGNYRQLNGHLLQKKILSQGKKFTFDEVDRKLIEQSSALSEIDYSIVPLKEAKQAYARKAFLECNQNYTLAAQKLCISPRSLRMLLQA